MSLDKYQQAWKAEASQVKVTFDANLLSKEVWKSRENFRSLIFWRDVREVGVAIWMIPGWFVLGNIIPVPWTWWLTVPVFLWIAGFILVDRKLHPQSPSGPGEPLLFYAIESLTQVEHQIWLLRNIFWWYLLPPSLSLMAFFVHVAWNGSSNGWGFALVGGGSGLFLLVIYGFIYWINQWAVRNQLEPRRQQLMKLVASLEGESDAADSDDIMELVSSLAATDQNSGLSPNWATWSQNWNRIIPSWREVALIIVPTLAGAYCGFRYSMPEAGPVFFQSVVAAVIPFEIMFFGLWHLSYRRHKGQPLTATGTVRPNAPAIVILVMILLMSALAFAAIFSFVNAAGSRSGSGLNDISAHADEEAADAKDDDESASDLPINERLRARLVGRYQLTPDFIFDVQDHDGHLMVGITNQSTQEVYPDSATKWSYRSIEATLEFKLGRSGPASQLTLHQNGIKQVARRIKK